MRLYDIKGELVSKNVSKYRVDWDGKSKSKLQFQVKQFLKEHWFTHIVYEEFPVFGSRLRLDFFNANRHIVIEVDGSQHDEFNEFFHKDRWGYVDHMERDSRKFRWIERNELHFIQIKEKEIPLLSPEFIQEKFGICII